MPSKKRIGFVISNKMNKTITVIVKKQNFHKKYGKRVLVTTKYKVHDEHNKYKVGDIVKIEETRPLSKTKFWQVLDFEQT